MPATVVLPFTLVIPTALAPVRWWTDAKAGGTRLGTELPPGPCRLFAATLAAGVLPVFEREHPDDLQPLAVVAAARAYALGRVTARDRTAWRSAAATAMRTTASTFAAGSVAEAAAVAAAVVDVKVVAWNTVRAVAGYAAWTVAWNAVGAATWAVATDATWAVACTATGVTARAATQRPTQAAVRVVAWHAQARLLRLYRPPRGGTHWLSPNVRALATAVVADPLAPDGSLLPVLADALDDAGAVGWLTAAFRDPAASPLCCPGWWLLRTCRPLPTTDPDGVPIT